MSIKTLTEVESKLLSPEMARIFLNLHMAESLGRELPVGVFHEPQFKIIASRLPDYASHSPHVITFASCLCDRPGMCVLWAYTLHRKQINNFEDLLTNFPNGFPSDQGYRDAWESQKDGGANLLDRSETWEN